MRHVVQSKSLVCCSNDEISLLSFNLDTQQSCSLVGIDATRTVIALNEQSFTSMATAASAPLLAKRVAYVTANYLFIYQFLFILI